MAKQGTISSEKTTTFKISAKERNIRAGTMRFARKSANSLGKSQI
jgi:hypothetical protein